MAVFGHIHFSYIFEMQSMVLWLLAITDGNHDFFNAGFEVH